MRTPEVVEDSRDSLGSFCALGFPDHGRAVVAFRDDTHPAVRLAREQADGRALQYRHRNAGGSWNAAEEIDPRADLESFDPEPSRIAIDAQGRPLVLAARGVWYRLAATWELSAVEASGVAFFDLTFDAATDMAFLLTRHGSDLEVVGENDRSYWVYRDMGPMDSAWPEVVIDPAGQVRACFARDHNILVY